MLYIENKIPDVFLVYFCTPKLIILINENHFYFQANYFNGNGSRGTRFRTDGSSHGDRTNDL